MPHYGAIALFMVNFAHLHYYKILYVYEAISGYFVVLARNCLAFTLDYIVMQMRKINREKGYWYRSWRIQNPRCGAARKVEMPHPWGTMSILYSDIAVYS